MDSERKTWTVTTLNTHTTRYPSPMRAKSFTSLTSLTSLTSRARMPLNRSSQRVWRNEFSAVAASCGC